MSNNKHAPGTSDTSQSTSHVLTQYQSTVQSSTTHGHTRHIIMPHHKYGIQHTAGTHGTINCPRGINSALLDSIVTMSWQLMLLSLPVHWHALQCLCKSCRWYSLLGLHSLQSLWSFCMLQTCLEATMSCCQWFRFPCLDHFFIVEVYDSESFSSCIQHRCTGKTV